MRDAVHRRFWDTYDFVVFLVRRFIEDRAPNNAAALTYTTLFAVVPTMTVTFAMLSVIPAFQGMDETIQRFIFLNFVPSAGEAIEQYLRGFVAQARQLTWLGVGLLAVTAFTMLVTIEKTFNEIWRVRQARRGLASFLIYWAILSLGPLLLGAGLAMSTYITSLSLISGPNALPGVGLLLRFTPLLLSIAAFTLIYSAVPNARVPLKHAFCGALFTAVFFEAAKKLFSLYVTFFPGYKLIYGAFATFPLFLLWIYVSWLIVLFGAELTCNMSSSRTWRRNPLAPIFILLGSLRIFLARFQNGQTTLLEDLHQAGWPLPEDDWERLLNFLEKEQLVCRASGGGWILCRDLHQFPMARLVDLSPWKWPSEQDVPEHLDEPWFPRLKETLRRYRQDRNALFTGSVAQWLQERRGQGLLPPERVIERAPEVIDMNRQAMQAWVSGRVQGVYYRQSTQQQAELLGISGWVRNLEDGRVELVAEGTPQALTSLREWLERGPPEARVEAVEVSEKAPEGMQGFEVRR